jgi:hypothetical protein
MGCQAPTLIELTMIAAYCAALTVHLHGVCDPSPAGAVPFRKLATSSRQQCHRDVTKFVVLPVASFKFLHFCTRHRGFLQDSKYSSNVYDTIPLFCVVLTGLQMRRRRNATRVTVWGLSRETAQKIPLSRQIALRRSGHTFDPFVAKFHEFVEGRTEQGRM